MSKRLTLEDIVKENEKKLQELIPNENDIICRYMNFPKFMSLLVNKKLFFIRADKFEDPLEGEVPEQYLERLFWDFDSSIGNMFYDMLNIDKEKVKKNTLNEFYQKRKTTFISCWNKFDSESYALWKIYAQDYGVAIQTTVKKLKEVTESNGVEIYNVKYLNESSRDFIAPRYSTKLKLQDYNFFVFKKAQYKYENEIRAIQSGVDGEFQEVRIDELSYFIEKIIVSPFADKWFLEMVRDVTVKFDLNIEVVDSSVAIKKN